MILPSITLQEHTLIFAFPLFESWNRMSLRKKDQDRGRGYRKTALNIIFGIKFFLRIWFTDKGSYHNKRNYVCQPRQLSRQRQEMQGRGLYAFLNKTIDHMIAYTFFICFCILDSFPWQCWFLPSIISHEKNGDNTREILILNPLKVQK